MQCRSASKIIELLETPIEKASFVVKIRNKIRNNFIIDIQWIKRYVKLLGKEKN